MQRPNRPWLCYFLVFVEKDAEESRLDHLL